VANISNINELFLHELGDIYDAEHQFLKGQEEMLQGASDATLRQMISTHIEETRQQIANIEQVYGILGQKPERIMCDGAKGIVSEGQKGLRETAGASGVRDVAIANSAARVEHYEISAYQGLLMSAQLMGQPQIAGLLQQNLQQEERTAQLVAQSLPVLLETAMNAEGISGGIGQIAQQHTSY
jgi:ferritin-like metal-binding protein YciE